MILPEAVRMCIRALEEAGHRAYCVDGCHRDAPDDPAHEQIYSELCKLLLLVNAEDLLACTDTVTQAIPLLAPCVDFRQHSPHHAYDVFTHTAYVVEAVPKVLALRWAALLHDIGKPVTFTQDATGRGHFKGHAQVGGQLADEALRQLNAPAVLRERVVFLVSHHMMPLGPDIHTLRRHVETYGEETVRQLLALQQADFHSKGVPEDGDGRIFIHLQQLLDEITHNNNACCRQVHRGDTV